MLKQGEIITTAPVSQSNSTQDQSTVSIDACQQAYNRCRLFQLQIINRQIDFTKYMGTENFSNVNLVDTTLDKKYCRRIPEFIRNQLVEIKQVREETNNNDHHHLWIECEKKMQTIKSAADAKAFTHSSRFLNTLFSFFWSNPAETSGEKITLSNNRKG